MEINNCLDRIEDKLDPRQYMLASIQGEAEKTPDEFMDLMKEMSEVGRQIYGTCTAWANTKGIKEFQEKKKLSQYFTYVMSKKISQIYNIEGEYIVNSLKATCDYGVPEERFMPDVKPASGRWIDYVKKQPSEEAFLEAKKNKGETYWHVNMGEINFRNAIFQNRTPTIFALKWYDSYNRCPQDGVLPAPDRLVGYHAVCGVGWDKDGLWVKNSFGERWGNKGYFKILFSKWNVVEPYACYVLLDKPNIMTNVKIIKIGEKEIGFYLPATNQEALKAMGKNYGKEIPLKDDGISVDYAKLKVDHKIDVE